MPYADGRPMEQRWRYEKGDGTPVWLPLDPSFLCVYCDEPIGELSMGGPALCGTCDCGYSKKTREKWTFEEAILMHRHANERIDTLPPDPAWAEYEAEYNKKSRADGQPG